MPQIGRPTSAREIRFFVCNNWALQPPGGTISACHLEMKGTAPSLRPLCIIKGDRTRCRVLCHSLCTPSFHPPPLPSLSPPHVSSVKWKCRPIKNRQPGADHCRTYANVDTGKYHTRRGGGGSGGGSGGGEGKKVRCGEGREQIG